MTTSDKRHRRTTKTPKTGDDARVSAGGSRTSAAVAAAKAADAAPSADAAKVPPVAKIPPAAKPARKKRGTDKAPDNAAGAAMNAAPAEKGARSPGGDQSGEVRIKDISVSMTSRPREDRHASIALAAYFRSESRGFAPGHEVEDWLAAEEEVDQLLGEGRAS